MAAFVAAGPRKYTGLTMTGNSFTGYTRGISITGLGLTMGIGSSTISGNTIANATDIGMFLGGSLTESSAGLLIENNTVTNSDFLETRTQNDGRLPA